jgi:cellulose synthase/poly-beta-1,6-N-acetylglucosamine synthase-like glycosyltransferase
MLSFQEAISALQIWSPPVREVLDLIHAFSVSTYQFLIIPVMFFSVLFYMLALVGIFMRPKGEKIFGVKKWPKVTIQIPTFNELAALRCAKKCLELDYPKDKLEIIIGDDSNDKEVSARIDEFARKHKIVKVTRRGSNVGFKAGNLNYMLRFSEGEIIVIFDSDFIPPKKFLKKAIPPFLKSEEVGCVQVKWSYMNMEENIISKLASTILAVYHHVLAVINHNRGVSLLFGSAQAIRKDLLLKLGGWQEGSLTEDVEFSLRVLRNGYKTVYLTDMRVPSEVPFTLRDFANQQRKWAYGNAKAFLQHARWIFLNNKLSAIQKFLVSFTLLGYLSSLALLPFAFFVFLSLITGKPAPFDFFEFLRTSLTMLAISAGFLATGWVGLLKEGRPGAIFLVTISSLTLGLFVAARIMEGVINAFIGKKMDWLMIRKRGNDI